MKVTTINLVPETKSGLIQQWYLQLTYVQHIIYSQCCQPWLFCNHKKMENVQVVNLSFWPFWVLWSMLIWFSAFKTYTILIEVKVNFFSKVKLFWFIWISPPKPRHQIWNDGLLTVSNGQTCSFSQIWHIKVSSFVKKSCHFVRKIQLWLKAEENWTF